MATKNYREIQEEYLRRSEFASAKAKRIFREYHTAEPIVEKLKRLSKTLTNGCHEWTGKIGTGGYAYISYRIGRKRFHKKAAKVAYELKNGPVPVGKEVSHICPEGANRRCVNPDHLIAETHRENLARRSWSPKGQRYKVNCKHCGQPKVQVKSGNRTEWACSPCRAERAAKWRDKTGYNFNDYRNAIKDRINANRRASRREAKLTSS